MLFKLFILLVLFSAFTMFGIFLITDKLLNVSKSNKFRKWWSNNVVDLDNKYND
jgi:hypothetical protein